MESKKYVDASDNATEYSHKQVEDIQQTALEDIDNLFTDAGEREEELWDEIGVNETKVLADFDEVPRADRDLDWSLGFAGLATAATIQFFIQNRGELILKPVAYREQMLDGLELAMTGASLATYAGRASKAEKFAPLKKRYLDELNDLKKLSDKHLYLLLKKYDAIAPTDQLISSQVGYVARMTGLRPGSPQFTAEVSKLINMNSTRVLKGLNRPVWRTAGKSRPTPSGSRMAGLVQKFALVVIFAIAIWLLFR
jgi:hypothetical protein